MKRISLAIFMVCVMAASAWGQKPTRGGHLRVALPDEPPGLDPTSNPAAAIDRVVYANICEALIMVNDKGELVPGLAERWEVSPDGLKYTFYLRKGVRFHNGEPFNAEVAAWNLKRAMAEGTQNPHPEYYRGITEIQVPDPYTLVLTLKEPDSLFLFHLAEGDSVMLPLKGYEEMKSKPVGTGPFKFVEWVRGDKIVMERFEGYWNPELPYLDKVTMRFIPDASAQVAALKTGDVDVIGYIAAPESVQEFVHDKRFKVYNGTTTAEVIVSINNRAKPFDDVRVRRAMAHAIDKRKVIELAMFGYGTPIGSHWSPSTPYYVDLTNMYPYDPQKAKALLLEAGYPNGFDAVIKLPDRYAYSRRSGEVVADMLAKVGIRLKIEIIEWGQWIDRIFKNKEYQLTCIGHAEAWDIGIYAKPGYYFNYESQRFNETYTKALKAVTEEEKARYFGECQRILAEDAVNVFLFCAPNLPLMRAEIMGWWENYPTIAIDCTKVWIKR